MKKNYLFILLVGVSLFAKAQKLPLDTNQSSITYKAKHLAHAWEGVNQKLQGLAVVEEGMIKQIAIKAAVRDFDSNNANRDSHALEVLEALQFPEVRFYSKQIRQEDESTLLIDGVLSFHGIEIPKTVEANYKGSGDTVALEGNFNFQATDFKVKLPSFMLVKINDRITIEYAIRFRANQ